MIPGFDIAATVNLAVRFAFFVAGGAGALAIAKSVHDFRHGGSGDYGANTGGDYGEGARDSGRSWFGGKEEGEKVGKEAEVQAREKQLFQDVVTQEIQEKELGKVMKGLQEDMKMIITQTESARQDGFKTKEQHQAYLALWKNFYGLILSAENYLRVISAKDLQLWKEFQGFVQDINARSKREAGGLRRDLKKMDKDMKKILVLFEKLKTGILAVHSTFTNAPGLKLIMMNISALGTAGRFPVSPKDKIPPKGVILESILESLEKDWLKRMVDKHRASLHTGVEAYEEMIQQTEDFARELQRVKAELELTIEKKEMESPEAKAREGATPALVKLKPLFS
ncbi:hypothetical protein HYT52_05360 [Candidatus Woesearchaeota archaeon]|nr:hypothetical protein [Candidatus Woesearchaeota archaeon]